MEAADKRKIPESQQEGNKAIKMTDETEIHMDVESESVEQIPQPYEQSGSSSSPVQYRIPGFNIPSSPSMQPPVHPPGEPCMQPQPAAMAPAADVTLDEEMSNIIAQIYTEHIKYGKHTSEIYSPPRVTAAALARAEFPVGFALDLGETDSYDNKPWDFTIKDKRERAEALVRETKPLLLIGSPPCTSFCTLFLSNKSRMKPHLFDKIVAEGLIHL